MLPLTVRQRLFVQEYLVDLCGKAAAIRAGYAEKSAKVVASRLLGTPHVQAALEEAMKARATATGVTAERVIQELALVAFSDVQNHITLRDGVTETKDFVDMPDGTSRAIEAVSSGKDGRGAGVKLHDKMAALQLLAKHLGICKDQVRVDGNVDTELTIKVVKT